MDAYWVTLTGSCPSEAEVSSHCFSDYATPQRHPCTKNIIHLGQKLGHFQQLAWTKTPEMPFSMYFQESEQRIVWKQKVNILA